MLRGSIVGRGSGECGGGGVTVDAAAAA